MPRASEDLVLASVRPEAFLTISSALSGLCRPVLVGPGEDLQRLGLGLEPKLLIVALGPPPLAGPRSLQALRSELRLRGLAILALSEESGERALARALRAGADDFLSEPFGPLDLGARVKALLRQGAAPLPARISVGGLALDLGARQAVLDGRRLHLTQIEFLILAELARRKGRVTAKERLEAVVWGRREINSHTLDSHLFNLRRKLGRLARAVENVYGAGYRLSP